MIRKLQFEITTRYPLPLGEQVFVCGDTPSLGNWTPPGYPLTRIDDLVWIGDIRVPSDHTLEYKITRGSWETEACETDGTIPPNHVIPAGDKASVSGLVMEWRDRRVLPPEIEGDYRIHERVKSTHLRHARTVIVWLPPSYDTDPKRRYPVLYMQDGQQVFDPNTATAGQDWEVDEWCTKLIAEERLQEIIVVGVYSSPDRFLEYNPSQLGPDYARFLLEELKPFIDQQYRTRPERAHTAVAGSSMGGGMAFYLAWEHPDHFFGAACLSPAFKYGTDHFMLDRVAQTAHPPDLKLYLYCGSGDDLEKRLTGDLDAMIAALGKKKIRPGPDLLRVEDPRGQHNEASWALHTDHWLLHLFAR